MEPARAACLARAGFAHFTATAAKHGLRVRAITKRSGSVSVNVLRYSIGDRVTRPTRVASFRNPRRTLAFGAGGLPDGWYAVQATAHVTGARTVVRSDTFHRIHGHFLRRADFYGKARCGDLASFHLSSPVFGGPSGSALTASYRVGRAGSVSVVLFKGRKVIRRFRSVQAKPGQTYSLRIAPSGLSAGAYTVRAEIKEGVVSLASLADDLLVCNPQPYLGAEWLTALRDEWKRARAARPRLGRHGEPRGRVNPNCHAETGQKQRQPRQSEAMPPPVEQLDHPVRVGLNT